MLLKLKINSAWTTTIKYWLCPYLLKLSRFSNHQTNLCKYLDFQVELIELVKDDAGDEEVNNQGFFTGSTTHNSFERIVEKEE